MICLNRSHSILRHRDNVPEEQSVRQLHPQYHLWIPTRTMGSPQTTSTNTQPP